MDSIDMEEAKRAKTVADAVEPLRSYEAARGVYRREFDAWVEAGRSLDEACKRRDAAREAMKLAALALLKSLAPGHPFPNSIDFGGVRG